jgi:hypothetical protein
MNSDQHIWRVWANAMQRWGIHDWVASLLEAAGPLTVLAAQVLYVGQPLLNQAIPGSHIDAIARILEQPAQARAFASFLREETPT